MKKSKYSYALIMSILKQAESGEPVADLCHEHGMRSACFYKWRSKYGGMDAWTCRVFVPPLVLVYGRLAMRTPFFALSPYQCRSDQWRSTRNRSVATSDFFCA